MKAEFDRFDQTYEAELDDAIGFAGQEHGFYVDAKARRLLELARRRVGDTRGLRVLDVGCGVGLTDMRLQREHSTAGSSMLGQF